MSGTQMIECSNCTRTFSKAVVYLFQSSWGNLLNDFLICVHICFWMVAQAFYPYLCSLRYCHSSVLTNCGRKLPVFFVTLKHALLLQASYILAVVVCCSIDFKLEVKWSSVGLCWSFTCAIWTVRRLITHQNYTTFIWNFNIFNFWVLWL